MNTRRERLEQTFEMAIGSAAYFVAGSALIMTGFAVSTAIMAVGSDASSLSELVQPSETLDLQEMFAGACGGLVSAAGLVYAERPTDYIDAASRRLAVRLTNALCG